MANEVYENSWWGSPVQNGWGGIYYNFAYPSEVPSLLTTLQARASYYENVTCTTATLTTIENIDE